MPIASPTKICCVSVRPRLRRRRLTARVPSGSVPPAPAARRHPAILPETSRAGRRRTGALQRRADVSRCHPGGDMFVAPSQSRPGQIERSRRELARIETRGSGERLLPHAERGGETPLVRASSATESTSASHSCHHGDVPPGDRLDHEDARTTLAERHGCYGAVPRGPHRSARWRCRPRGRPYPAVADGAGARATSRCTALPRDAERAVSPVRFGHCPRMSIDAGRRRPSPRAPRPRRPHPVPQPTSVHLRGGDRARPAARARSRARRRNAAARRTGRTRPACRRSRARPRPPAWRGARRSTRTVRAAPAPPSEWASGGDGEAPPASIAASTRRRLDQRSIRRS